MNPSFTKTLSQYKHIGVDSMCFIYYFEANPMYGKLTKQLFSLLQTQKIQAVTSVLTLAEILTFEPLQQNKLLFEKTKAKFFSLPHLTILSVDATISETASILKYRYSLTLPDALQLATAIVSNQDAFVSNDTRFKKVKEIPVLLLDDFLPINVI